MKIRTDFVTNSSSSSFVIGTVNTADTIDDVYLMVRQMFIDLQTARNEFMKVCEQYGMSYDEKYRCFQVKYEPKNTKSARQQRNEWEKEQNIIRNVEMTFGMNPTDPFPDDTEWTKCETYAEYEQYWIERIKAAKKDKKWTCAPFSIGDYLEDLQHIPLEDGSYGLESDYVKNNHVVGRDNLTGWYFDFYTYGNSEQEDKDAIEWLKREYNIENVPNEKVIAHLMGRYCIHSESGLIPYQIVEKLEDMSEFSCNHMG